MRSAASWGGPTTASDGEVVQITVSDTYPVDSTITQGLADFLVQLYHGPELSTVAVYVAPLSEVETICGPGAGGCYDPDQQTIVAPGENLPDGTSKETVLVHELGHHVARSRVNPPWTAEDWGTKRWASVENICMRVADSTAFPGDEGSKYLLNPGEAFAESYRILNFQKQAWASWTVSAPFNSDESFYPDAAALDALRLDVVQPWKAPTVTAWSGRVASARRSAKRAIATPLDGSMSVKLTRAPAGASIAIVDPRNGAVLAKGPRRASFQVCGKRNLVLLVKAKKPGAFSALYATP